jgi:HEXXH motif-containing protein
MTVGGNKLLGGFSRHWLSWENFDALARNGGGAGAVDELRRAERSRRVLLLRALVDLAVKSPELAGPLPSAEDAWELLARAQYAAPAAVDLLLDHPYLGSWVGYTTRVLNQRITGVFPLWVHVGHVHALAVSAAIRAGIGFTAQVPVWQGRVSLPTLGLVRMTGAGSWSVASVHSAHGAVEVGTATEVIHLPTDLATDHPQWWAVRHIDVRDAEPALSVRLDDVDPYRGIYEPLPPQRLTEADATAWRAMMADAWKLITRCLPEVGEALRAGFDSVAPRPFVPFRTPSASNGDAFGSAIIARPLDSPSLAAMLVHEFQHSLLSGVLHVAELCDPDPAERFYVAWRDDPRHAGGVLQGLYAFFGVTAFWRALASEQHRAAFEFAYHRAITWCALRVLRKDPALTDLGRRFIDGIASILGPWQKESVPPDIAAVADAVLTDHYLGWRLRHVRPAPETVTALASAWFGNHRAKYEDHDQPPTPVPDGDWSYARADLVRHTLGGSPTGPTIPNATIADHAWVSGRYNDAVLAYRAELTKDPDRPTSLVGLALSLSAQRRIDPAVSVLLHHPELVRAVHRRIRKGTLNPPTIEELAAWLGRR